MNRRKNRGDGTYLSGRGLDGEPVGENSASGNTSPGTYTIWNSKRHVSDAQRVNEWSTEDLEAAEWEQASKERVEQGYTPGLPVQYWETQLQGVRTQSAKRVRLGLSAAFISTVVFGGIMVFLPPYQWEPFPGAVMYAFVVAIVAAVAFTVKGATSYDLSNAEANLARARNEQQEAGRTREPSPVSVDDEDPGSGAKGFSGDDDDGDNYVRGRSVAYWEKQLKDEIESESSMRSTGWKVFAVGIACTAIYVALVVLVSIHVTLLMVPAFGCLLFGAIAIWRGPRKEPIIKARRNLERARAEAAEQGEDNK